MSWIDRAMRRSRGLFWGLAALVIGPPFALALVLVAGLVTDIDVRVDVALIAFALVAGGALAVIAYALHQRLRPRQRVSVTYDLRLEQPLTPLGRYAFELSIYYDMEEKGERRQMRQGEIALRFRGQDHPDLLAWCTAEVRAHLEEHRRRATRLHPGAEVVVSPVPGPARIAEHVAGVERVEPPA